MRKNQKIVAVVLCGGLAIGCAGKGAKTGTGMGAADMPRDPLAAGVGAAVQGPKRKLTEDQQKEFDEAMARWTKARKEGNFANQCASIADDFGDIADDHPTLLEARHNQAAVLYHCGKKAEGMAIWEKLATGSRPYAGAVAQLGFVAWENGDRARAESLFERAIQMDKQLGSVDARLNLAQILREKSKTASGGERKRLRDMAEDHLRAVLAIDGNNMKAYAALCFFYFDQELYEMARLVGQQAVWRAEEIATGKIVGQRARLAEEETTTGRRGRRGQAAAQQEAPQTIVTGTGTGYTPEMKESLASVYNTLGLIWLRRKEVSQAIASFKKAVEMDPNLVESRMNLAALSLNYRDYATAEQSFRAVLQQDPKNYDAAIGLGVALRGGQKYDEAEQQYLAAQKLNPQDAQSYFNLGLLYQEYKGMEKPQLLQAQQFYREYINRSSSGSKRNEAEKRIKDIDAMLAALEEAARMQKEAEEMQRKMEEQQKQMQEELKKMQEQEAAQQAGPQAANAEGAPSGGGAAPAAAPAPGAPGKAAQ